MDTDELTEVRPTAALRSTQGQEDLPEIVAEAPRIPWWLWALGGALVAVVLIPTIKDSRR